MNTKFKTILVVSILFVTVISSCKKIEPDSPEIPNPCDANPGLKPNVTIFDIQKLYNNGQLDTLKDDVLSFPPDSNYVLQATVISSDEYGNIYKEMYIQDTTGAMKISIDDKEIYKDFAQGQVVQIKLSGLNIQKDDYSAIYVLGKDGSEGNYGFEVSRISSLDVDKYIFRKSCPKPENLNVKTLTIGGFYDTEVGKLVKFENVEFISGDVGTTYADAQNQASANKTLEDCSGNQLIVRTSGYATFAGDTIPSEKGEITGVLGKYGADYQLYIVKPEDVNFTEPRCN